MLAKRVGCLAADFHTLVHGQRVVRFDRDDAIVDLDLGAIAGDFLDRLLDHHLADVADFLLAVSHDLLAALLVLLLGMLAAEKRPDNRAGGAGAILV